MELIRDQKNWWMATKKSSQTHNESFAEIVGLATQRTQMTACVISCFSPGVFYPRVNGFTFVTVSTGGRFFAPTTGVIFSTPVNQAVQVFESYWRRWDGSSTSKSPMQSQDVEACWEHRSGTGLGANLISACGTSYRVKLIGFFCVVYRCMPMYGTDMMYISRCIGDWDRYVGSLSLTTV